MAITARDDYLAAFQKRLASDFAAPLERGKDPAPADARLRETALDFAIRTVGIEVWQIMEFAEKYLEFLAPKGDN